MPDDDWTNTAHYSIDPLGDVVPSLLNSVDIVRYANKGCLVHPFSKNKELLNPATYTIRLLGTLYSWEQKGGVRCLHPRPIREGKWVRIKANSITYWETKEVFRLPQYIAARFNLHIRYVHKGILLGTGPIVDPGFVGPLLIPLHNLTDNDYVVEGGDKLLWVEFTKLTHHEYWSRPLDKLSDPPPDELVVFRPKKRNLTAQQYFVKAEVSTPGVLSAFKGALEDSRKQARVSRLAAEAARGDALGAANKSEKLTFWGALGVVTGIAALIFSAIQLFQSNSEMASRIDIRLERIERDIGLSPIVNGASTQDAEEGGAAKRRSIQEPAGEGEAASDDDSVVEDGDDQANGRSGE